MVVATASSISERVPIMAADFRDTHALFHSKSGNFIGVDHVGIMWFGKPPLKMINGIWYMEINEEAIEDNQMVSASSLELKLIP